MSERIGAKLAIVALLALVLLVGAGNLSATFIQNYSLRDQLNAQQAAQQRAQKAELARLCATFGKLAALKPPAGAPGANPSRAWEQAQHNILADVGPDLLCPHP